MSCYKREAGMNRHTATRRPATAQRGFTLIELMVTLVILAMAGTFIYTVFITQHDSYVTQQDVSETQQDVRVSLDMLTRDLQSTGYGVSGGGTGITAATATSITFNVAQNYPVPSLVASPYITNLAGNVITVNNITPFAVNDTVRILSMWDRSQIGSYTISTINAGANQLTLSGSPTTAHQGDVVVGTVNAITYSLTADANSPGSFILQRTSTTNGAETLADHLLSLRFNYTLVDGSVTTAPAASDLPNIRMVQATLTSQTARAVAKAGANARTRSLSAFVRVMNGLT
jgi:prepilin-type N-terminal cleavage/methylation domain-containing protein